MIATSVRPRVLMMQLTQAPASGIASLVGSIDDQRLVFPELSTGEVPRLFSTLEYTKADDGR